EASITATPGVESSMAVENGFAITAKKGVSGKASGMLMTGSKVKAGAYALIDNSADGSLRIKAGGDIDVSARNAAWIDADITVTAKALPSATLSALTTLVSKIADETGLSSYTYTTQSGDRAVKFGDTVLVTLSEDDAEIDLGAPGVDDSTPVNIVRGDM